jgi:hypothetical protein
VVLIRNVEALVRTLAHSEPVLGPEVYDLLRFDNSERKNAVVMLLTSDDSDYPRVALLSPYQILAVDNKHLFINVYRESRSNKNLQEKKKGTLVVITPPAIRYVRVADGPSQRNVEASDTEQLYEFIVEEERSDFSPEAPIITSLLFDETRIKERYEKSFGLMLQAALTRSNQEKAMEKGVN